MRRSTYPKILWKRRDSWKNSKKSGTRIFKDTKDPDPQEEMEKEDTALGGLFG